VLQALLETGAAFPQAEQAVEWLMTERRQGHWSNTQENFFVLYALSEYFRKYETETPQFTARVRLAGREVMSKLFSGRTAGVERRVISLTDYQEKKVQAEIAKEGPGTLYYGLRMNYYPREYDDAREEGITLVKVMEPLTSGRSAGEKNSGRGGGQGDPDGDCAAGAPLCGGGRSPAGRDGSGQCHLRHYQRRDRDAGGGGRSRKRPGGTGSPISKSATTVCCSSPTGSPRGRTATAI